MSHPSPVTEFVAQAEISLGGETVNLLAERAMWMPRSKSLLIADLHLGKATHFRKSGIGIPAQLAELNLRRLDHLILQWQPKEVIFLGDLFHSQYNAEWDAFGMQISRYRSVAFILVRGNHDILDQAHYDQYGIKVCPDQLKRGPLLLTHNHLDVVPEGLYNLSGHIHPGYRMHGKGRQSLLLPCFHLGPTRGLLPAFGGFTGSMPVQAKSDDRVWIIVNDQLMEVTTPGRQK